MCLLRGFRCQCRPKPPPSLFGHGWIAAPLDLPKSSQRNANRVQVVAHLLELVGGHDRFVFHLALSANPPSSLIAQFCELAKPVNVRRWRVGRAAFRLLHVGPVQFLDGWNLSDESKLILPRI